MIHKHYICNALDIQLDIQKLCKAFDQKHLNRTAGLTDLRMAAMIRT